MEDCAAVRENSGFSLQTVRASVMKLLRNRAYILFLVLIGIAAFGFTVTHFAMGIDDFGIGHYMDLDVYKRQYLNRAPRGTRPS